MIAPSEGAAAFAQLAGAIVTAATAEIPISDPECSARPCLPGELPRLPRAPATEPALSAELRVALAALGRYGAACREHVAGACQVCGALFVGLTTRRYCSDAHRQAARRARRRDRRRSSRDGLPDPLARR